MVSKLQFSGYFTHYGQNSAIAAFNNTKEYLLNEIKSKRVKADLSKLELELNGLFYSQNQKTIPQYIQQYQDAILNSGEQKIISAFNNFNLNAAADSVKLYNKGTTVSTSTLQKWIANTNQNLELIKNVMQSSKTNPNNLSQISNTLQRIVQIANAYLNTASVHYESPLGGTFIGGNRGVNAVHLVKKMMAFDAAIRKGQNLTPQQFGELFEEVLARSNQSIQNNGIEQVTSDLLKELMTGANTVSRGRINDTVSYTMNISDKNSKQIQNLTDAGFTVNYKNMTATYSYNPNSEKMGKMDVIIQMPTGDITDPIEKLRVSAKNWTSTRTVGSTSLDAGLIRAVGQSVAEVYKLGMLNSEADVRKNTVGVTPWTCAEAGHQMAKVALASDIVMGLNQGSSDTGGLANVLIINDQSHIYVKDITSMITDISKIDQFLKYKNSSIEIIALANYRNVTHDSPGRTNSYLALMTSALNKMTISYNLSKDLSLV